MKLNLPVIILNGTVLLPNTELKLELQDEISKNIIDESELFHDKKILVVTKTSLDENILINELPKIGTITKISKKLLLPNGNVRVTLKGIARANVINYLNPNTDVIESIIEKISEEKINDDIKSVTIRKLYNELDNYIKKVPYISDSVMSLISGVNDLDKITDIIVNNLITDNSKKFEYLMESNSIKRVEMILCDMYKEEQLLDIEESINIKVKNELDEEQKRLYIKEKIKHLKSELGELSTFEIEVQYLKSRLEDLNVPIKIKEKILYEIDRYENMSSLSPEISMVRSYIDFMLNLPWNRYTTDIEDLNLIKNNLNKSHFCLNEVKHRIIEYLAVKKESNDVDSPVLCLVGPPGVGKTTFARSIADSMGRNFVKISLGGVDDEAIIKGHIRTYLGSLPGKIMDGIKRAGSSNPVFLIDEIDKMSNNYKGDPASALLEVLDINQNKYFKDNYVDEEYDLSKVLFITTANDISNLPDALKDRLEIIHIDGYTELEKLEITKSYIIPKYCLQHGLKNIKISDEDILNIIKFYTKESGVRELERMILKIIRKVITNKVLGNKKASLTIKNIEEYLGKRIYNSDVLISEVGLVNGLCFTNYGGDIVPIEANYYEGNGNLIFTGSLGEVMSESVKIALSYIKANYKKFNIDYEMFKNDIHINLPNIDIRKEGPSAGIAITTCIISALSNLKVGSKIAMTGEITLRGNVMSVGRIKEKVIGAYINNIDTIFIPHYNLKDLDDIPNEIKEKIKFIPVKKYDEIYNYLKELNYE